VARHIRHPGKTTNRSVQIFGWINYEIPPTPLRVSPLSLICRILLLYYGFKDDFWIVFSISGQKITIVSLAFGTHKLWIWVIGENDE
jgi:hypothetical protein